MKMFSLTLLTALGSIFTLAAQDATMPKDLQEENRNPLSHLCSYLKKRNLNLFSLIKENNEEAVINYLHSGHLFGVPLTQSVRKWDEEGYSPLFYALEIKNKRIIVALLLADVQPNDIDKQQARKLGKDFEELLQTPKDKLCQMADKQILEMLTTRILDDKKMNKRSSLHRQEVENIIMNALEEGEFSFK